MAGQAMKLYRLGTVSWLDSQLICRALPQLGMEGPAIPRPGPAVLAGNLIVDTDAVWHTCCCPV